VPLTDLPLAELAGYQPELEARADFDAFWARTLAEARAQGGEDPVLTPVQDTLLTAVDKVERRRVPAK
jgi:cephalosporin-C deacetylase